MIKEEKIKQFEIWRKENNVRAGDQVLVAFEPPDNWWDLRDFRESDLLGKICCIRHMDQDGEIINFDDGVLQSRYSLALDDAKMVRVPFWCVVKVGENSDD
jgi:hypothetical protein